MLLQGLALKVGAGVALALALAVGVQSVRLHSARGRIDALTQERAALSASLTLQNQAVEALAKEAQLIRERAQEQAALAQKQFAASQKRVKSVLATPIPSDCTAAAAVGVELSQQVAEGWQ